jgi:hypothetical protein
MIGGRGRPSGIVGPVGAVGWLLSCVVWVASWRSPPARAEAPAAAEPPVVVWVTTLGLSAAEGDALEQRVRAELDGLGVAVAARGETSPRPAECGPDPGCVGEVLRGAGASHLVWLEAVRAGGLVQLDVHLADARGAMQLDSHASRRLEEVFAGAALLPTAVVATLRASAPPPPGTGDTGDAVDARDGSAPFDAAPKPHVEAGAIDGDVTDEPDEPDEAYLSAVGAAALAGGLLAAGLGAGVTVAQLAVIGSAQSLGAEKEAAAVLVPVMATVGAVGVAAAITGTLLLVSDPPE